ncbi:MAG: TolC family protein [Bacteroidota bacterium]
MGLSLLTFSSCKAPSYVRDEKIDTIPQSYLNQSTDTTTIGAMGWKSFFKDPLLLALIDSALVNNQELNIQLMELQIGNNEVMARKGEYLPSLGARIGGGADKVARYTTHGAMEESVEMEPGKAIPKVVGDLHLGVYASWEVDIWKKLRNAKYAAQQRYLASVEGRNFMTTQIVAEIANSYYDLLAFDKQLEILDQNIEIQSNALKIVRMEKLAARVTELAVLKFEAEVYYTKSLRFEIQQKITEVENRINLLVGRFPQAVARNAATFESAVPEDINSGIPAQLIDLRTDVKQAELNLKAAKLDVKVAKASFYPTLSLDGGLGLNAFNPKYIIRPQSILYNIAGNMVAPLLNRNALKANYYNTNAKQMQSIFNYERTILNAVVEVTNQISNIDNLKKTYDFKNQQVSSLTGAIKVSNDLFASARADYMEILLTQRDVVEAKFDLVETKNKQFQARINIYKALGGGWK